MKNTFFNRISVIVVEITFSVNVITHKFIKPNQELPTSYIHFFIFFTFVFNLDSI